MLSKSLQNFLEKSGVKYELIEHKIVYTAFDKAATLRAKLATIGKTVIVSFDNKDYAMGLIPGNKNLNKEKVLAFFNRLRQKSGQKVYKKIDFAKELWMKKNIKSAKLGATPPFGALYKLPFFIDNSLVKQTKIVINGGEYESSLKISPANLLKINPNALKSAFSQPKK